MIYNYKYLIISFLLIFYVYSLDSDIELNDTLIIDNYFNTTIFDEGYKKTELVDSETWNYISSTTFYKPCQRNKQLITFFNKTKNDSFQYRLMVIFDTLSNHQMTCENKLENVRYINIDEFSRLNNQFSRAPEILDSNIIKWLRGKGHKLYFTNGEYKVTNKGVASICKYDIFPIYSHCDGMIKEFVNIIIKDGKVVLGHSYEYSNVHGDHFSEKILKNCLKRQKREKRKLKKKKNKL